jgi:predicted acylesterase/phospholipase RssA
MTTDMNTNPAPTHLTLISQGGISLGAFMAGVFFEIVREALEEKHLVIDIITGASAGAMTATIASYYLLKGTKEEFTDPKENALYQAWVEKADMQSIDPIIDLTGRFPIEELEVFKKRENRKPLSLLSGDAIKDITKLVEYTPQQINRPLALLMTVTSLQGLIIQRAHDQANKSISSAEYRQFLFYPGLENEPEFPRIWKKARDSSRASGAFPTAFPPIDDNSSLGSINLEHLSNDYFENGDPRTSSLNNTLTIVENGKIKLKYSDGGILDNLPILKGLNLEASITNILGSETKSKLLVPQVEKDKNYAEFREALLRQYPEISSEYQRLYVYVKPNPISNIASSARLTKKHFTMLETLLSALTLPNDEHEATQLKQIIEIEEKVKLKEKLLQHIDDDTTKQIINEIVPYNFIILSPISPLIINTIKEAIDSPEDTNTRLRSLQPLYEQLMRKDNIKKGLNNKDSNGLLASDFISAFGGFFDKKYREHDFLLGRICGITWLHANFDIQQPEGYIERLAGEIDKTILSENPSIENLKFSSRIRLFRIGLRFFRITILEFKADKIKSVWDLFYLPLAFIAAIILRGLDLLATALLFGFDALEKSLEKNK